MQLTQIRLRKPRRVFPFLCDPGFALQRDEPCIVQTDRGTEWGVCLLPPEPVPYEMERRYSMRVIRKANPEDHENQNYLIGEEKKARRVGIEKIQRHNLPMKLVDVEYTFDKQKVIFYFTAEDRVDFRDLVRDLAHDLRARIELRHIQVRDEAKMVGGIGGCGRELCCTTWLNDFMPISMRMAKRQNLSLNPSKISGQCGRLLCCLSYENDQYEAARREAKANEAAERARRAEAGEDEDEADSPRQEAPRERGNDRGQERGGERGARQERGPRRDDRGGGRPDGRRDEPRGRGGEGNRDRGPQREQRGGGQRPQGGGGPRDGQPRGDRDRNRGGGERGPRPQGDGQRRDERERRPQPEPQAPRADASADAEGGNNN